MPNYIITSNRISKIVNAEDNEGILIDPETRVPLLNQDAVTAHPDRERILAQYERTPDQFAEDEELRALCLTTPQSSFVHSKLLEGDLNFTEEEAKVLAKNAKFFLDNHYFSLFFALNLYTSQRVISVEEFRKRFGKKFLQASRNGETKRVYAFLDLAGKLGDEYVEHLVKTKNYRAIHLARKHGNHKIISLLKPYSPIEVRGKPVRGPAEVQNIRIQFEERQSQIRLPRPDDINRLVPNIHPAFSRDVYESVLPAFQMAKMVEGDIAAERMAYGFAVLYSDPHEAIRSLHTIYRAHAFKSPSKDSTRKTFAHTLPKSTDWNPELWRSKIAEHGTRALKVIQYADRAESISRLPNVELDHSQILDAIIAKGPQDAALTLDAIKAKSDIIPLLTKYQRDPASITESDEELLNSFAAKKAREGLELLRGATDATKVDAVVKEARSYLNNLSKIKTLESLFDGAPDNWDKASWLEAAWEEILKQTQGYYGQRDAVQNKIKEAVTTYNALNEQLSNLEGTEPYAVPVLIADAQSRLVSVSSLSDVSEACQYSRQIQQQMPVFIQACKELKEYAAKGTPQVQSAYVAHAIRTAQDRLEASNSLETVTKACQCAKRVIGNLPVLDEIEPKLASLPAEWDRDLWRRSAVENGKSVLKDFELVSGIEAVVPEINARRAERKIQPVEVGGMEYEYFRRIIPFARFFHQTGKADKLPDDLKEMLWVAFAADEFDGGLLRGLQSGTTFGVELEYFGIKGPMKEIMRECIQFIHGGWNHGTDGTIRPDDGTGGIESRSPVFNEASINRLHPAVTVINQLGGRVLWPCAMHVHYGVKNTYRTEQILPLGQQLSVNYAYVDDMIVPILDRDRTPSNRLVFPYEDVFKNGKLDFDGGIDRILSSNSVANLQDFVQGNYAGRQRSKINFMALARHGTFEFREHPGTTDPRKVTAWVKFIDALGALSSEMAFSSQGPHKPNDLELAI